MKATKAPKWEAKLLRAVERWAKRTAKRRKREGR